MRPPLNESIVEPEQFYQSSQMALQLVKLPDVERVSSLVIRILAGNPGKACMDQVPDDEFNKKKMLTSNIVHLAR